MFLKMLLYAVWVHIKNCLLITKSALHLRFIINTWFEKMQKT